MGRLAQTRSLCLKINPITSFKLLFICFHFAKKLTSSSIQNINKIQWWTILHKLFCCFIWTRSTTWDPFDWSTNWTWAGPQSMTFSVTLILHLHYHLPAPLVPLTKQSLDLAAAKSLTTSSQKRPINNTFFKIYIYIYIFLSISSVNRSAHLS